MFQKWVVLLYISESDNKQWQRKNTCIYLILNNILTDVELPQELIIFKILLGLRVGSPAEGLLSRLSSQPMMMLLAYLKSLIGNRFYIIFFKGKKRGACVRTNAHLPTEVVSPAQAIPR